MTRTTNSIVLFDDVWAADGDTTSPPFDPRIGWDSTYSQVGGNTVSRTLVNGEFNKFSALGYDVNRFGSNLYWDATIIYEIGATVLGSDNARYIAVTQNSNNDPTLDGGTNWTPLKITFAHDANITISQNALTNTVTIGFVSNLSDKANSDLSNVSIGDFSAKIANGRYTYTHIVGSRVQINSYEILTDSNITFSASTLNKQMTFGTSENLSQLKNNYTGASEPSPTVAGQFWNNTSYKTLYIRNNANTDWVAVGNADSYSNVVASGTKNINNIDSSRLYILDNSGTSNPVTLQLPANTSVDDDFRMDFVSSGNSDITILAFSGESFYRDDSLVTTYTLSNQENNVFSLIKNSSDNNFYLIGAEKSLDDNLSNITNEGLKVILDFMCPVGAKWTTYSNNTPPLNGILGVTWELIGAGNASVTAAPGNGGVASGTKTLNSSLGGTFTTESHVLRESELPPHRHLSGARFDPNPGGVFIYGAGPSFGTAARMDVTGKNAYSSTVGSGAGHSHNLDIKTITEISYKRLS